jgi:hypothetical protein
MPLPQKNNQIITLADASKLTANFRKQAGKGATKGGLFWKEYIEKIIDQPDCVAIRYYYAQQDDGIPAIVMVGVDVKGNDMTGGTILELGALCPPFCPPPPDPFNG